MNQQMLDELIGAAPPSTVNVEGVVRRSRRRRLIRRLVAGGSTATAVVVAIVVGAGLLPGEQPEQKTVPQVAAPTVSPSPSAFALEAGTEGGRQRILDRLQLVLEQSTTEHAPNIRWIYMPDEPGEKPTPDGHPVMFALDDDTFRARSGVTADGRKGGFFLSLRPTGCGSGSCEPFYECAPPIADCQATRTGSGLRLVRYVDEPGRDWRFYGVDVELPDRKHAVHLSAVNYFGGDGSEPSAPTPVFTRAQLEAIATDIAETITD